MADQSSRRALVASTNYSDLVGAGRLAPAIAISRHGLVQQVTATAVSGEIGFPCNCACMYMTQSLEVLNVNEVAALLRCSKAHVCKAIGGKVAGVTRLPAISMGRRKLVRRTSLDAWLAQNDPARCGANLDPSHL